jgi:hypothetical protein
VVRSAVTDRLWENEAAHRPGGAWALLISLTITGLLFLIFHRAVEDRHGQLSMGAKHASARLVRRLL